MIDLTEARRRARASATTAETLAKYEDDLVRILDGDEPIPDHLDKDEVIAGAAQKITELREKLGVSTPEEQVKTAAIEQLRNVALTAKVQNEAIEAAVEASNVEGVTPETVMLQDPDAVLAVIGEKA